MTEYALLGQDWVRNFICRHPQLQTVVGKTIESARIERTNPEKLKQWFNEFEKEVINDPDVLIENVYNMDESGFSIGSIKVRRVIIDLKVQTRFLSQLGHQE